MGFVIAHPSCGRVSRDGLLARALQPGFPEPHAHLRCSVVIPARNEEAALPALIASLAAQRDLAGAYLDPSSIEVLLLLNNCTDATASVARALQRVHAPLRLHVADIAFSLDEAHVGRARQVLFDAAFARFHGLKRMNGLTCTTDADSRPAPDWIVRTEMEVASGVVGVGGRITLDPDEAAALPYGVRKFLLLDIGYRRALEELRSLYAPEPHDPFPRHHQHFGGSLAVTAAAYAQAGGMPLRRSNEDVALYHAIVNAGGRFRHSPTVRVQTSARLIGRAHGGLADALGWWQRQAHSATPVMVESVHAAEVRLAALGLWCADNPGRASPASLRMTPDNPAADRSAEIHDTLRALRSLCAALRPLSLSERLIRARGSSRDVPHLNERAA